MARATKTSTKTKELVQPAKTLPADMRYDELPTAEDWEVVKRFWEQELRDEDFIIVSGPAW